MSSNTEDEVVCPAGFREATKEERRDCVKRAKAIAAKGEWKGRLEDAVVIFGHWFLKDGVSPSAATKKRKK